MQETYYERRRPPEVASERYPAGSAGGSTGGGPCPAPRVGAPVHDHRRAGDVATTGARRGRRSSRRPPRASPARRIGTCSANPSTTSWPPYCSTPSVWIRPGGDADRADPEAGPLVRQRRGHRLQGRSRHRRMSHHRDPSPGAEAQEEHDAAAPRDHPARRDLVRQHARAHRRSAGARRANPSARCPRRARRTDRRRCSPGCRRPPKSLPDRIEERGDLVGLAHVAGLREHARGRRPPARRAPAPSGSGRRPQIATRAPVRASSRAVARPMPVPPPVTRRPHGRRWHRWSAANGTPASIDRSMAERSTGRRATRADGPEVEAVTSS